MRSKIGLLWTTVFVILAVGIGCSKGGDDAKAEASQQVRPKSAAEVNPHVAPDFVLQGIDGKTYSLSSYRGKVIILDFWDTWCPPCKAEIPDFVDLQKQYGPKGLQIIGIAFARQGLDAVKSFVKEYKINYPILLANPKVVQDYGGITGIPTTFVIDKQGRIQKKFVGYRSREVWESEIAALLSAK